MNWLPGWQSAAAAGWWSNAWFWASLASLLFLGVCEMISHRYSERKDELAARQQDVVQRQHDKEIADLQFQTAEANRRAAEARLALEKYKAPRTLSAAQRATFALRLQPFSGQKYVLSVAAGQEAADLVCLFDKLLTEAGWVRANGDNTNLGAIKYNTDCGPILPNVLSDVHVRVTVNPPSRVVASGEALLSAIAEAEIAVHPGRDPANVPGPDVILLMVGAKP
jgi:hypothetical protein